MTRTYRVAIFNDTRRTSHYGCEIVMETLISNLHERGIEPTFFWPMGEDWRGREEVAAALRTVDAVIVNGEGSIHHSARRDRAHYLTEIAAFARTTANIPSFLINSSLFELEPAIIDNLRHFDAIYLRESRSLAALEGSGIGAAIVPDLTLLTPCPKPTGPRTGMLGTDSVKADLAARLNRLSSVKGWDYSRLTHAAFPSRAEHGVRESLRRGAKWLHAVLTGRNTRDRKRFVAWLATHQLLCTGRFHAVTLALATHTPFLALASNTPKISGLLEDVFGHDRRVVPLSTLETVSDPSVHLFSATEEAALTDFLESTRTRANTMFDTIRSRLDCVAQHHALQSPRMDNR